MNTKMSIALTNLGQYNEGILNYVWLDLPATDEELEKAFEKINVSYGDVERYGDCGQLYEEFFITDYECDYMNIGEYENLDRLNEIAEAITDLEDYEQNIVVALMNDGYSLEQALDQKDDCYFHEAYSMEDIAREYMEETGLLAKIPDDLVDFFDFEAYGEYLENSGHWISTDNGYIEVID